jgi:hypothetical protein
MPRPGCVSHRRRDVAEFLDVDVDQVTGRGVPEPADRFAGGPLQVGQASGAGPAQERVTGRGGGAETPADPAWAQPLRAP